MKKILFVDSEGVPFIKTGGLADVVGSLPKALDKRYFDCRVVLPYYSCMAQKWNDERHIRAGKKTRSHLYCIDRRHATAL